ncbi:MAG: hypothetical protein FJZ01_25455 [Candidatus Sericytochromatia bacterium]|nr:hypothetical protein [Candidatus Tanganyikabacteria bacterium]
MKRSLAALALALAIGALIWAFGGRAGPSNTDFWRWFQAHSAEIKAIKTGEEPIAEDLDRQLKAIDEHLTYEFGPQGQGAREFFISADGRKASFGAVKQLVAAAPKLEGWKVVAFRQRKPKLYTVSFGGVTVDPDDVYFAVVDTSPEGTSDLVFAFKGVEEPGDAHQTLMFQDLRTSA